MNYFIYKGINSNTFNSLVVQELPAITKPPIKYQTTTIDGRDGDITETLGYKAYDKEISIGLKNMSELDSIIEWLTGNGELTLSNEPDKYYNAQILNQINFDRLVRFRTAKIKFHVQPFKYSNNEEREIEITYNNKEIKFIFDEQGKATFDSEKEDVSSNEILLNRNMIGDFITLKQGDNVFTWTGTITKWEIQKKSRWI